LISAGYELWERALLLDRDNLIEESKQKFQAAANSFFTEASGEKSGIGRALNEYSTVLDAFSSVQEGRLQRNSSIFEEALVSFSKASEILRATIHYAFMASYISGCVTLETAPDFEDDDEKFQGYKNAISLFEQSKIALSFRDDRHPLLRSIDSMVKYAISRALLLESDMLAKDGSLSDARKKREQSNRVEEEFLDESGSDKQLETQHFKIDYFLKGYECERALVGSYLVTFPERNSLWIGNVGSNPAFLETLGKSDVNKSISSCDSILLPMEKNFHGRLRISYKDEVDKKSFDEGCLTVI
jgi:hypothetical protein